MPLQIWAALLQHPPLRVEGGAAGPPGGLSYSLP